MYRLISARQKHWAVWTALILSMPASQSGGRKSSMNSIVSIPDFGGVVVKADSEGRLGPSFYGRTPADAANVIARALKPHNGIVFYRAFVYNHHLDWTNLKNDRAQSGLRHLSSAGWQV